ncbi:MAG: formylglycine-generating enzyme family protein [Oligoflexia bacterium]|nr:formylglycine-generating enzyme family protein [Oligoflexia bacterium]
MTFSSYRESISEVPGSHFVDSGNVSSMNKNPADLKHTNKRDWLSSASFKRIDKGSFMMGPLSSEKKRVRNGSQKFVEITKPFEIMEKEVTQRQWFQVMRFNPSRFKQREDCRDYDYDYGMCPHYPVERVSWNNVQEYIKKLNNSLELTGCQGRPEDPTGCYRLPTEAEWEWAARGGTKTAYSFGNNLLALKDYGWFSVNSERRTHKVGTRDPNPWGLYDVHGNVWEWVQDQFAYELPEGKDPLNENTELSPNFVRVIRGGAWNSAEKDLRSSSRYYVYPAGGADFIGFRLVRNL